MTESEISELLSQLWPVLSPIDRQIIIGIQNQDRIGEIAEDLLCKPHVVRRRLRYIKTLLIKSAIETQEDYEIGIIR